jgi:pimeloyl-ACP methyl ester carboxylesterase
MTRLARPLRLAFAACAALGALVPAACAPSVEPRQNASADDDDDDDKDKDKDKDKDDDDGDGSDARLEQAQGEQSGLGGTGTLGAAGTGTSGLGGVGTGTGVGGAVAAEKRRVTFAGSRGDTVPGYLWLPQRSAGQKFPTVLLMYGIKGDKDSGSIGAAAELISQSGYAALTIDWPGTGERGSIGNQERIMNTDVLNWTVGDYGTAFQYLQTVPEVDTQRLGYVGASMGAMTGSVFAAREPLVKAMVAIVPIPNPLWGGDDPSSRIGQIAPRPVLCISTNDNSDFSSTVCARVGAGGEKQALSGGHELEGMQGQVVASTVAFLNAHLKP